jgi:hypothetical protein
MRLCCLLFLCQVVSVDACAFFLFFLMPSTRLPISPYFGSIAGAREQTDMHRG